MELLHKDDNDEYFDELLRHIRQRNNAEVLAMLKDVDPCQIIRNSGDTLLHFAAGCGNVWLVRYLIDLGANIDVQNSSKETPLMLAVQNQKTETSTETVKLLLEANAEMFVVDKNGKCALRKSRHILRLCRNEFATDPNRRSKLRHKIEISKNIAELIEERVTCESLNRHVDSQGFHIDYPLYLFISIADVEITRVLLEKGSPVNAKDPSTGDTSLHIAVRGKDLEKVELLLKYDADVNAKNHEGETPLACIYSYANRVKILDALMAAGADLIDRDRGAILVKMIFSEGNKEAIRNVLKYPIDLHFIDEDGRSVLHYLAENSNPDVFEELRDFDFHVDIRTENSQFTVLHRAAYLGHPSSVQFLVDRGADVDATCTKGNTPLACIFARSYYTVGHLNAYEKCVEILLASGADPRLVTKKNRRSHRNWLDQPISTDHAQLINHVLIHLSAVEASGREIGEYMRREIQSIPQYQEVFDSKKEKLEKMKDVKLDKSLTLLDFVVANKRDISLYARNRRIIIGSINEVKENSLDPCYQRKLRGSLLEFTKLIELRKECAGVVCKIIAELYNIVNYDIAEKIVDYVEDDDLRKLLETTF